MRQIIPTQEYILAQKKKFEAYDYYGIPYGIFDNNDESMLVQSQREKDIEDARLLILEGKQLPEELGNRILNYKKQNQNKEE